MKRTQYDVVYHLLPAELPPAVWLLEQKQCVHTLSISGGLLLLLLLFAVVQQQWCNLVRLTFFSDSYRLSGAGRLTNQITPHITG